MSPGLAAGNHAQPVGLGPRGVSQSNSPSQGVRLPRAGLCVTGNGDCECQLIPDLDDRLLTCPFPDCDKHAVPLPDIPSLLNHINTGAHKSDNRFTANLLATRNLTHCTTCRLAKITGATTHEHCSPHAAQRPAQHAAPTPTTPPTARTPNVPAATPPRPSPTRQRSKTRGAAPGNGVPPVLPAPLPARSDRPTDEDGFKSSISRHEAARIFVRVAGALDMRSLLKLITFPVTARVDLSNAVSRATTELYAHILKIIGNSVFESRDHVDAHQAALLFGLIVLVKFPKVPDGGPAHYTSVRQRLAQILDGRSREAVDDVRKLIQWHEANCPIKEADTAESTAQKVSQLINLNQIGKASQVLLSSSQVRPMKSPEEAEAIIREKFPVDASQALFQRVNTGDPPSPEELAQIEGKRRRIYADGPLADDPARPFSKATFLQAVKSASLASSPGWAILNAQFFQLLVEFEWDDVLYKHALDIASGFVPRAARQWYTAQTLTVFNKKDGGARPIMVTTFITRLVARSVAMSALPTVRDLLAPHQLAVGTPGGVEAVAHAVQFLMHENADETVALKLDIANAFGSIPRVTAEEMIVKHGLSTIMLDFFRFFYGHKDHVFMARVQDTANGTATRGLLYDCVNDGVFQGCPIAVILTCLVIKSLIDVVVARDPNVLDLQMVDDFIFVGPVKNVVRSLATLLEEIDRNPALRGGKFDLQSGKTFFLALNPALTPQIASAFAELWPQRLGEPPHYRVEHHGETFVGVPIGSAAYVQDALSAELATLKAALNQIVTNDRLSIQQKLHLIRQSLTLRPCFLLRTVRPDIGRKFAKEVDDCVLKAVSDLVDWPLADDTKRTLVFLPMATGGLGLQSASRIVGHAYMSSALASLNTLTSLYHSAGYTDHPLFLCLSRLRRYIDYRIDNAGTRSNSINLRGHLTILADHIYDTILNVYEAYTEVSDVRKSRDQPAPVLPGGVLPPPNRCFSVQLLSHVPKLQQFCTTLYVDRDFAKFFASLSPCDAAKVRAAAGPYASLWLTAAPTEPAFTIDDPDMRHGILKRVCVENAQHYGEHPGPCPCRRFPDEPACDLHYESTCPRFPGPTLRHDSGRGIYAAAAASAGCKVAEEPRGVIDPIEEMAEDDEDGRSGPDIVVYNLREKPVMVDVTYRHPACKSKVQRAGANSANTPLFAAHAAEKEKNSKYLQKCKDTGYDFLPLAFEVHGGVPAVNVKFMDELAKKATSMLRGPRKIRKWRASEFKMYWLTRLIVDMVRTTSQLARFGSSGARREGRPTFFRRPFAGRPKVLHFGDH